MINVKRWGFAQEHEAVFLINPAETSIPHSCRVVMPRPRCYDLALRRKE